MKAVVHRDQSGFSGLVYEDFTEGSPQADEVKVRMKTAGLNHRDLFVVNKRHLPTDPPLIPGSDGAGIIEAVGEGVTHVKIGDEVVINPSLGWPKNTPAPPEGSEILGLPDHGTFAETIVIPAENVGPKPKHLSWDEAGVLTLAALTGYRALFTRGRLKAGQTVLFPGIGSGVATFMLQMAKASGARVIVTSRSAEKQSQAVNLGADLAIHSDSSWVEQLAEETIDLIVDSVGSATFNKDLSVLKKGGTLVVFGSSTNDEVTFNLRSFFYGQYNMLGSTLGSGEEFHEMLAFVEKHKIASVIDSVYPIQDFIEAFKRLAAAEQFGKIALKISEED